MVFDPDIKIVKEDIHRHLLRKAYEVAWNYSDDPVTKTGAVIMSPSLDEVLAYGANHIPKGLKYTQEDLENREWKYKHIIHAEQASIFAAAGDGKQVKRAVMYTPWTPCHKCALAIIDSGISKIVLHKDIVIQTPERWLEDVGYGLELFKNAGVEVVMYDGRLDGVKSLFNGKEWEP